MRWLVAQLGGSPPEQAAALASLRELSASPEAQQILISAGGVAALVAAARSTSGDAPSQAAVALVLARLALPPHTEAVAAGGATPVLIDALRLPAGGAELTLAAAAALQQLVRTAEPYPYPNSLPITPEPYPCP